MVTAAPPTTSRRSWLALSALVPALLVVGLDGTILSVALPTLARDLSASTDELQWFVMAYTLAFAGAMLPAGLLGDRWGRRRVLLASLATFALGSLACALSHSPGELIAARVLLGVGAAGIMPTAIALLAVLFDDDVRPRATAALMVTTMLGYPIGPILGGWMLQHVAWGWVFGINVPLALLAAGAVAALMPESRAAQAPPVDAAGVATSSAALALVCYGVTRAGDTGWSRTGAWAPIVVGAALGALFWRRERHGTHPLVPPALFRAHGFAWGVGTSSALSFVLFGVLFVVPQYSQAVLGTDAQGSGLRLLPAMAGLIVGAGAAPRLTARLPRLPVIAAGFGLMAASMVVAAGTTAASGDARLATWVALAGVGLGLSLPPAMDLALADLDPDSSGVGSGALQAVRMVAGTLGAALLGSVLNAGYRSGLPALDGLPDQAARAVRGGVEQGLAVAGQAGSAQLAAAVRAAFVDGMGRVSWVCAALGVAVALAVLAGAWAGGRRGRRRTMAS